MTQLRAERIVKFAHETKLDLDIAGKLYDALPEMGYREWDKFISLVALEIEIGSGMVTRALCLRLAREAGKWARENYVAPPVASEPETDVDYTKDRLMLLEMVVRGDLHPEVVAPRLLDLALKHPHHESALKREAGVYERHPRDWGAALAELKEGT